MQKFPEFLKKEKKKKKLWQFSDTYFHWKQNKNGQAIKKI